MDNFTQESDSYTISKVLKVFLFCLFSSNKTYTDNCLANCNRFGLILHFKDIFTKNQEYLL